MPLKYPHECMKGSAEAYAKGARSATDKEVMHMLSEFETKYRGSKPGGSYQTPRWRIYKRIWHNEARLRGLGT